MLKSKHYYLPLLCLMFAHSAISQTSAWNAPADAIKVANPLANNSAATNAGAILFKNQCFVCHGSKGKGDGPAGMSLSPRPANLQSARVASETDGSLFWKISTGHSPMPSFKATLSEKERWEVVNFIRSLQKTYQAPSNKSQLSEK